MGDPCSFGDPTCPCQDGDVCHYVATEDTPAMAPPRSDYAEGDRCHCGEPFVVCGCADHPNGELVCLGSGEDAGHCDRPCADCIIEVGPKPHPPAEWLMDGNPEKPICDHHKRQYETAYDDYSHIVWVPLTGASEVAL